MVAVVKTALMSLRRKKPILQVQMPEEDVSQSQATVGPLADQPPERGCDTLRMAFRAQGIGDFMDE